MTFHYYDNPNEDTYEKIILSIWWEFFATGRYEEDDDDDFGYISDKDSEDFLLKAKDAWNCIGPDFLEGFTDIPWALEFWGPPDHNPDHYRKSDYYSLLHNIDDHWTE